MTLQGCYDFTLLVSLHLDYTDVSIRTTNSDIPSILVDADTECYSIPAVNLHDLLYHPDVPSLEDTVGVTRCYVVAAHRELSILDRIEMSVEGLDSEACSHVPDGQRAIGTTRHEEVSVGLEGQGVY